MERTLNINIFDYKLIRISDIEKCLNLNYKMYAILSFERMHFKNPQSTDEDISIDLYNSQENLTIFLSKKELIDKNYDPNDILNAIYPTEHLTIDENYSASDYNAFFTNSPSFKIEYIGISLANNAPKRLSNHSTLQKILIDNNTKNLNKVFYVLLFNANYIEINTLNCNLQSNEEKEESIMEYLNKIGSIYENVDNITALTEAILINTLKPEYNIEYKNTKSNKSMKTFEELCKYGYEKGVINLSLNKEDIEKSITLYTEEKCLKFNPENYYRQFLECPFNLDN